MSRAHNQVFQAQSFSKRVGSMLRLDFYRLFHTPAFYIMLAVAAIIPAMVLSMSGMEPGAVAESSRGITSGVAGGVTSGVASAASTPAPEFTNAWQLVESTGGSAVAGDPLNMSGYANINMVFIFAGLLMAIFVARDYSSGFVKSIFTTHSKKIDYVISKSAIGVFGGAGMILTYVFGTVIAGLITGAAFDVNVAGLVMCLLSKILLMGLFCALFLAIAVFFKSRFWLTIIFTFLLGMMFYPAASVATLSSTVITVLIALAVGIVGALALGSISTLILKRRDLV